MKALDVGSWPQSIQVLGVALLNLAFAIYLSPSTSWGAVAAWMVAMALFLLACRYMDEDAKSTTPLTATWAKFDWLICISVAILALGLRLYKLDSAPLTLHNDEAVMGLHTIELMAKPTANIYIFDEFSTTKLWYYILSIGVLLNGQTQAAIRIMPALLGALTIVPMYIFARHLFNRLVATIAVVLLATYHFHIHFSRAAVNNVTDPLWATLIYTLLYAALVTQRRFLFGLTGLLIGLALHFYTGARLFVPLTGLAFLLWILNPKMHQGEYKFAAMLQSAVLLALGVVFASGLLVFTIIQDPYWFLTRVQLEGLTEEWVRSAMESNTWSYPRFWWEQIQRSAGAFHIYGEAGYRNYYDVEKPLLSAGAAVIFTFGIALGLRNIREWRYQLLFSWLALTMFFGGALLRNPPAVQRYVTLAAVVTLFMAVALSSIYQFLLERSRERWPHAEWLWQAGLLVVVLYISGASVIRYFGDYLPRETYGTARSQTATLIGNYLLQQPASAQVFYLGEEMGSYYRSGVPRYLAHHLADDQIHEFVVEPELMRHFSKASIAEAATQAGANPVIFFVHPKDQSTIRFVEQHCPTAKRNELRWPHTDETRAEVFYSDSSSGITCSPKLIQ